MCSTSKTSISLKIFYRFINLKISSALTLVVKLYFTSLLQADNCKWRIKVNITCQSYLMFGAQKLNHCCSYKIVRNKRARSIIFNLTLIKVWIVTSNSHICCNRVFAGIFFQLDSSPLYVCNILKLIFIPC